MLQSLKNAWKDAELRKGMLFTIFIIVLYRIGAQIPIPYVDGAALAQTFSQLGSQSMFQYFNLLSGDAFSRATLFALSISPYITASIVIQLLTVALPPLENLAKQGEEGRKKLTQITRYTTVALSLLTAYGYYTYLRYGQNFTGGTGFLTPEGKGFFPAIVIIACYCAGASLIMWLGEKINDHGLGNGISIILLANILASLVPQILSAFGQGMELIGIFALIVLAAIALGIVYAVIFLTDSERRIPVQYAKRQVGRKLYGGHSTHLPIKLNMTGVMPIIFASAIVTLPQTIAMFAPKFQQTAFYAFVTNRVFYAVLMFILIVAFAFFYVAISFNPIEVSNNLKANGGVIPGIRPGKPTTDYIVKILNRVTLIGSLILGVIAVLPIAVSAINPSFGLLTFSGSSTIIVVGVILETVQEIDSKLTMRHYKGFLD